MEVILLEKSRRGNIGDIVKVAGGYGRNYLIPEGKAVRATEANKADVARRKAELEAAYQAAFESANMIANQLGRVAIDLVREASEDLQLYGSVTARDIADAVKSGYGMDIDHHLIHIPNRIKEAKIYDDITIRLHHDVVVPIELNVVRHDEKKKG